MGHIIETKDLTKDYGRNRGVFGVDIAVRQGTCHGFLGPNGAGKTTAIRHLMGFSKPDSGYAGILGLECWTHRAELQRSVGYLPGEICFPKETTGSDFLSFMARMRNIPNDRNMQALLERFELDPGVPIPA